MLQPGVNVLAPAPGGYNLFSGTSFAAAHVSGLAVLLSEILDGIEPSELVEILKIATVDLGAPGRDRAYGLGRVDALLAVLITTDAVNGVNSDGDFDDGSEAVSLQKGPK